MPPRLPDLNGPGNGGNGLQHSASLPRISAKCKTKKLDLQGPTDLTERIEALGGFGYPKGKKSGLGGSSSTPDLRVNLGPVASLQAAQSLKSFKASDALFRAAKAPSPTAEGLLPPGPVLAPGTWSDFIGTAARNNKVSLDPLPATGKSSSTTSPLATTAGNAPAEGDVTLSEAANEETLKPKPKAKAAAEYPKTSIWNFAQMPLENFDEVPKYEVRSPEEWMALCNETPDKPQACVGYYRHAKSVLAPCWVKTYNPQTRRFSVELDDSSVKDVVRLSIRFNDEDADNWERRHAACRSWKAHCELQESLIAYTDSQPDASVTPFSREQREKIIRQSLRGKAVEEVGSDSLQSIKDLCMEVEQDYVRAMKFCQVKTLEIENYSTRQAFIDPNGYFAQVLGSFLPLPIPEFGLKGKVETELGGVPDIAAIMDALPTMSRGVRTVVMLVWHRFTDQTANKEILDTVRGLNASPLERRGATVRKGMVDEEAMKKRTFGQDEFLTHMQEHMDTITKFIQRNVRDYIIAEVTDRMAEGHNFFNDDVQHHNKSPLHLVLKKLDCILNSHMRWFVAGSLDAWVDFMQSFVPSPSRCLAPPLLVLSIIANHDQGEVRLEPDPEELIDRVKDMLDKIVPSVTELISTTEWELVPFCNLPPRKLFEPLATPDGVRCEYEPLDYAKETTESIMRSCMEKPLEMLSKFQHFAYLLTEEVHDLDPLDVEATRKKVADYRAIGYEIEMLSASVLKFPLFEVHCQQAIETLSACAYGLADFCLMAVASCVQERATEILDGWEQTYARLSKMPEDEEELAQTRQFIGIVEKQVSKPLMQKTREVHRQIDMVDDFSFEIDPQVVLKAFQSFSWPIQINLAIGECERELDREKVQFIEVLEKDKKEFWQNLAVYKEELEWVKTLDDYTEALKISGRIDKLHANLQKGQQSVKSFSEREKLFQIEECDYSELEEVIADFAPYYKVWEAAIEYKHLEEEWTTSALSKLNAAEIESFVDDQFKDSYKMAKNFEGTPNPQKVAQDFRKDIVAFKKNMPIIQALCQEAIEEHHFLQLFDVMEVDADLEDGRTLQSLLDLGILNHIETVERISTQAQKQYGLKQTMKNMKKEWKTMEFGTMAYKNTGTYLIKGTDDIQTLLDDHIIKTQAVRGSPFVKPIEKEVRDWEAILVKIQDLLEQWLACQRTWLYLEPIFGAEDIIRQMPESAKAFQSVDTLWRNTLNAVVEQPNVIDVSEIENLLPNFVEANKKLDKIQKSLNDYLETKRLAFPRFFFLSNDELLMILSQTKDPTAVQPHMGKCFEGINSVRFDGNNEIIESMISIEGEEVVLFDSVNVVDGDKKGNVEKWLLEVQDSMISCLTRVTKESIDAYAANPRDKWVLEWPGQVVICVDNIYWTKEVADAIASNSMQDYHKKLMEQLLGLVELVRGDLSKLARRTLTATVTIDVHNRDVVKGLCDAKVHATKDFEWMQQLRYYWAPKGSIIMYDTQKPNVVDKCQVSIINSTLLYGFEYLGNSDRLVVTPLTDRCYRTLMGAFNLFYGGAPEGPAGTGKTESTKDLAKAMSVQCVVFNCSDGLDYLAMGKFFKGLASSGAWCCFDEFNRINLEVLSVIAQQVFTICMAVKARQDRFIFEGTDLKLVPSCAVNITMNPGYAGRSELPDNLKALFRPCAMMVPDYALIGEIVLYSFGFGDARYLAVKAVASLRLGSEQLSSQDHYDFGMRALKSILVAAGQLRRKFGSSRPEEVLMLSALNDVNLPKFTANDIPLFIGITGDLLPGVKLPESDYGKLMLELEGAARGRKLQVKDTFIHKCTQLWETIMVRHGLMIVGMNISGKTQVENVLADALAAVADGDTYLPVQMHRMNPKSIKQGELYGDFDENTHEWTDGILALCVRFTAGAGLEKRQWIMLDGPVDAVWIENMNTVLDDNKKLCLASGEIIKLSGVSTMMFEVEDLAVASPATVSRCGMVFMEQVDIGWRVLMMSWCDMLPERLQDHLEQIKLLFDANVDCLWEMVLRKIKSPVPPTMNWIVTNLIKMFWSMLRVELPLDPEENSKDLPAKEKELKIENCFWLSVAWSFGCTTDSEGRKVMNEFIRDVQMGEMVQEKYNLLHHDHENRPVSRQPFPADHSVYDFFPHTQTNKWESWTKKITNFEIPKDAQVHTIIVPTADTVRSAFLLQTLVNSDYHVLFSGLTGTGKTVVIAQELLKNFDKDKYTSMSFAFSAQSTSRQTQDIIDGKLDKRRKGYFGPPVGKRCLVFVDDLNMPTKETYGAQPPIELLRQWMDTGGWYDRKTKDFRNLIDLTYIGAMGPPGAGRPYLTGRYQRHYSLIYVTPFETESLSRIFNEVLKWFLGKFPGAVSGLGQNVVKATIELYNSMSDQMRPTPAKSHYIFNLRDISRVHQGICACTKDSLPGADDLIKCWAHEAHRVFYDRLVSKDDQVWFSERVREIGKEFFKKDLKSMVKAETLIWCDFVNPKKPYYQEVESTEKLVECVNECLTDYNQMAKRGMNLVLFMAAAENVCRIVRVLKTPLGNCLLVGVGGSGRKSLATLAIFQAQQDSFTIELTKSYGMNEWHDDMKRLLINVGGKKKEITFLLADTQIANENFLEETSSLLNNGEIPSLFGAEDKAQILELCQHGAEAQGRHGPAEVFAYFIEMCMQNLHIVLALSPIGESFRRRVRMFPSLVNCCTINWFHEWPDQALQSVANYFLDEVEMTATIRKGVVDVCVEMQKSVFKLAEDYEHEQGRHYYVTPTSYLELINAFKGLLDFKRTEVSTYKSRYDVGLDKIISTENMVGGMQAELEELRPYLKKTQAETEQLMLTIEKSQAEAAEQEKIVKVDEAKASAQAEAATKMKNECQHDLDAAMPALQSAIEALNSLKKGDIVEVKSMKTPPDGVVLVSKALCWCFNVAPKKVAAPDGKSKVDDYWDPAKKSVWGDAKLLDKLLEYDKDNIPKSVMDKLVPLEEDPAFMPDVIKKASVAACGICQWVRAMIVYDRVAKVVGPKKESLAQAENDLAAAEADLAEKKAALKEVMDAVARLVAELDAAKQKSDDLKHQYDVCSKRLVTAEKLINGLGGEKTRWTVSSKKLGEQFDNLTGDVLIASGIVAYLGAFLAKYRASSVQSWIGLMQKSELPASKEFLLRAVIGEDVEIRKWTINKLPNDQISIDNALILSRSRRWPLMIDPQLQANKWIRNSNGDKLRCLRLNQHNYARILEVAIAGGEPVLMENIPEKLDPLLEPLLQKAIFKAGNITMIRLGDSSVEYNDAFRFYLATKLPNPHYSPEICVQVTLLNFMVTPDGLEDQMLGTLVAQEAPDVEKKRVNLVIESAESKAQLKEIEDRILYLLSASKGNILDDEELINTLANSKLTSQKIAERVKDQEKTAAVVQQTRDTYLPVAIRCSAMFFVVADLCKVEPTYQYSLEWFIEIYLLAIKTAERPERNLNRRLQALQSKFIELLFQKVCDSLFEANKLMFSMLLTFKSMEVDKELDMEEKELLLHGGTTGATPKPKPPHSDWLSTDSWSRVCELEYIGKGPWVGFCDRFTEHIDGWKRIFDSDDPYNEGWPGALQDELTPLQKSLVMLAVRTDSALKGVQDVIASKLGSDYLEPPSFNLEKVHGDSHNCMPLIFVLSSGADPMAALMRLAEKLGMMDRYTAVSLGQGQGKRAEAAIEDGKSRGSWVILQNCHLSISWMPTLERVAEELDPDKISQEFRLWLTTMPSNDFPVAVLQNGMKMTVEPPRGLKSNILRAFTSFDDDWFNEACNKNKACQHAFRKMLFGLCFFHALIQERSQYGPLGWNIPYQFSEPDRMISRDQLKMFLEEQDPVIPYTALRYTCSECNYGGRVTDTHDRRLISTIITDYYCPEMLKDSYRFSESGIYYAPPFTNKDGYLEYIRSLPINQAPEAFGLHANANLSSAIREILDILGTANSMQGMGGGEGGGKSSDSILTELSVKYIEETRQPFDTEAAAVNFAVDYNESMNTVLNQEMLRFNKLVVRVRSSLADIGKAVKGLVVMDASLEEVATGMLRNTRPAYWMKVSYPSLKPLSSYMVNLQARLDFFTNWEQNGHPPTYWVSGFYFTQSFLTGQLQNFARMCKLPIDTLGWTFEVLKDEFSKQETFTKPETGCIVYGLFMDGARWSDADGCMAESFPKVLFSEIPYMHWKPCETAKDPTDRSRVFMSPLYKTSERKGVLSTTGHSTNFVAMLALPIPSHTQEKYWIKRGVACLTQLDS